jgi:transcription initiation factor TFIIIB Brf1 subunit/transcription initiation factor TFIIB
MMGIAGAESLVRRLRACVMYMEFKCPQCQCVIYSRKHKVCGNCGATLPSELLLTKAQIEALEKERARERKRAREFQLPSDSDY